MSTKSRREFVLAATGGAKEVDQSVTSWCPIGSVDELDSMCCLMLPTLLVGCSTATVAWVFGACFLSVSPSWLLLGRCSKPAFCGSWLEINASAGRR